MKRVLTLTLKSGHYLADVGGITPGSMPPFSRSIADEGAAIKAFKLVSGGTFQQDGIEALLTHPETGSKGTRKLADNLSDLKAQVAANQRGILLINELIDEYGLGEVQAYMGYVQDNAELAVRDMLREAAVRTQEGGQSPRGVDAVFTSAQSSTPPSLLYSHPPPPFVTLEGNVLLETYCIVFTRR